MVKRGMKFVSLLLTVLFIMVSGQFAFSEAYASDEPLERASLRLNWRVTGPHVPYFLGLEKGYFQDEGIDLELNEGSGSGPTAMLVDNKSDTFGLADAAALIPMIEKGMEIVCVAMITPKSSLAVIAREDSGIAKLEDLEGKKLAVTAGDALTQIWPAVVSVNNLDAAKIDLVYVDAAAKVPVVLEGQADALLGSSADQNFILEGQGVPAVSLDFADHGVNVLNLGIFVHHDLIEENPDLIRRFLRAIERSLEDYMQDPDEGIRMLLQAKPELDPVVTENQARAYVNQIGSPNCPDAPLLYNCYEDWEETLFIMETYRELDISLEPEDFYTNEFLP